MTEGKTKKELLPEYLRDNDFATELNFKLWVTKGARFKASHRCEQQSNKYTQIIAFVSAYLVILSVLGICEIPTYSLDNKYTTFISVSLSIIVLVSSQFLYASNYSVKSIEYHRCALEISKLYDRLRIEKNNECLKEKIEKIAIDYEIILSQYGNHLPIDYDMFKITKKDYFGLSMLKVILIEIRFFFKCDFIYYACILGLPIAYLLLANILKQD